MPRYHLLINKGSGGNERGLDASSVAATVSEIFTAAGHEIDSFLADPAEIEQAIRDAARKAPHAILIGGGDGTVSTAARLLGGTGVALGILPMGTFNLAARDLGVPLDIPSAARFLAAADRFAIDVLDVSGHACLCTTILGFYPEFAGIFEKRDHGGRWWRKTLKLITGIPRTFKASRPLGLRWKTDGESGLAATKFAAFVPGKYRPTAGIVPARTDFRSGKLTAYIGKQKTPSAALRGMLDYVLGRQELNPELEIVAAPSLQIRISKRKHTTVMLDGEIMRLALPLQLRILPQHLHVLTTAAMLGEEQAPESESNGHA